MDKKISIMQPYLFPYLPYFQLINLVDKFVFYDDVNFIKGGWINRNNILNKNESLLITFPCKGISSSKKINEIELDYSRKQIEKKLKTISQSYSKAPFFKSVFPIIRSVFENKHNKIASAAIESILLVSNYLNIDTEFIISSKSSYHYSSEDRNEKIYSICNIENCRHYINPIGGMELYEKGDFQLRNLKLSFLKSDKIEYPQFVEGFISNLSIIDVLMFNDKEEVSKLLEKYKLV